MLLGPIISLKNYTGELASGSRIPIRDRNLTNDTMSNSKEKRQGK